MWQTVEFGGAHEGRPGVLLADGTEPKPVYFDTGSSGHMHQSSDWWIYDGTLRAPLATHLRASCACGWRGESHYRLDWDQVDRRSPDLFDTTGLEEDWDQHIQDVEARATPLPEDLATLIEQIEQRLGNLAGDAPLAALRAISRLEHIITDAGRRAAFHAEADAGDGSAIGPGLGLPEREARQRLLRYTLHH
ncbi:hypothetical protein [Streptomyces poriferorum]|uniref:Uncharacterized protein n=1 Tax=Streptomyces poriferorum TaxID=2798799 RepID=A0ABY9IFK6_9ACTN|nr:MULTISPECIES: hypothetical protein [unclassified Streptomyces]MDP5315615.1 hypothetical protein [Streptomyces sp. Alt4]WLQ53987.1 hypothetical protein P8A19_00270 [Streptomyces sp. Alt2]